MALLDPGMPCPLCGKPLRGGEDIVATSHFIADASDPLWRYSDAAMHRSCFDVWEHRDVFTQRYRAHQRKWPGKPGALLMPGP